MNRTQKEDWVAKLKENLSGASLVVLTSQEGVTVSEITNLRFQMKDENANFKVVKNTLAKLAVKDTNLSAFENLFNGPTGIAYSDDPISAARVVVKFSETNDKVKVIAGIMNGMFMDANQVKALAKLPSLNELRGTLVGLIQAPATKLVRTINEPIAQIARLIAAYSNKSDQ